MSVDRGATSDLKFRITIVLERDARKIYDKCVTDFDIFVDPDVQLSWVLSECIRGFGEHLPIIGLRQVQL